MRVHHLMHHNAYLTTVLPARVECQPPWGTSTESDTCRTLLQINKALSALRADSNTKYLAKMGIDKLLQNIDKVPETLKGPVRNGGGGFVNHVLFWESMCKGGTPFVPDSKRSPEPACSTPPLEAATCDAAAVPRCAAAPANTSRASCRQVRSCSRGGFWIF
jgi:hypothetical protein